MERYDYKGAVHVHSTYSPDGHGSIEEIMAAANEAGLDFVVLTDHDTLKAAQEGHEKWHGSSLLIVGAEITPPQNHFLAIGSGPLDGIEELKHRPTQEIIDAVSAAGWAGFIAHPKYAGSKKFGGQDISWTDWSVRNVSGISIWNLLADWNQQLDRDEPPQQLFDEMPRHMAGPDPEILRRWDELQKNGRVVAIGECDNHKTTKRYGERDLLIFPYSIAFRAICNHLLLEEPLSKDVDTAKKQVVDALRKGSSYISMDWDDDPSDFQFYVEHDDGSAWPGDEFRLGEEDELFVSLPSDAHIRLIRNGEVMREVDSFELVTRIDQPGVYRAEVYRQGHPWIFVNPIFCLPAK